MQLNQGQLALRRVQGTLSSPLPQTAFVLRLAADQPCVVVRAAHFAWIPCDSKKSHGSVASHEFHQPLFQEGFCSEETDV